jgi:potassium efflux system protein
MLSKVKTLYVLLAGLLVLAGTSTYAQNRNRTQAAIRDSLRRSVLKRDSAMRSYKQSDASINLLLQKIEEYTNAYNQVNDDLNRGFDTLDISQKLPSVERRVTVMGKLAMNDKSCTLGYLFTIRDMLGHVQDELDTWQARLTNYNIQLNKIRKSVNDIDRDTAVHVTPSDSALRKKYTVQVDQLEEKWDKVDENAKKVLVKIGLMQDRVVAMDISAIDLNDLVDQKIANFSDRLLSNESGFIWQMHQQKNAADFGIVTDRTINLNSKLLKYFVDTKTTSHLNLLSHLATLLVLFLFFGWVYASKRKIKLDKPDELEGILGRTCYTNNHSFFSAALLASIMALYFYDQPPFIFLEMMLLVMMACIGVLIKAVWSKSFFKFWAAVFVLLIIYALSNLYMQVTYVDRIVNVFLCVGSVMVSILFLQAAKRDNEPNPPYTKPVISIFIASQCISLILNAAGRFSLAKLIGVSSIFNLCLGFGIYLFVQIVIESLFLQLEANKKREHTDHVSDKDSKDLQKKFRNVLVKLGALLWLIKLTENLDIDDFIYSNVGDFLDHKYQFSSVAFTFGSIVTFVLVIWLSGILSRVIIYFYDYAGQQTKLTPQAKKTRSSILLIRLTIFVVGFFIAIAASGIPMDRITIIIGALGVGIGFGLQNIVNNLVSGIILAIEKPVQVGDVIEVDKFAGTIKEIGIRSSKIEAGDGSEVIIPNGDLISNRVTNWTLTNNNRRAELIIKVAYGSDIDKVEKLLTSILADRDDIMMSPSSRVFLSNLNENYVEFKMWFWVAEISNWLTMKSKVMSQVYTEFYKAGIHTPQSQSDVRVFFPEQNDLIAAIKGKELPPPPPNPSEEGDSTKSPSDQAL